MSSNDSGIMNAANTTIVELRPDKPRRWDSWNDNAPPQIFLVADDGLLELLANDIQSEYYPIPISKLNSDKLLSSLSTGSSMVWIGQPDAVPADLWVGSFKPIDEKLAITLAPNSPLTISTDSIVPSDICSAYIKPVQELGIHNVNEEVRADFLPIFESRDRFGEVVGYPGVLLNYHSPSLVGRRFAGSKCWFFFFDNPCEAMSKDAWLAMLEGILLNFRSGIQIIRVETDYALYHPGERMHIRVRVRNNGEKSSAVLIKYSIKTPVGNAFRCISAHRRCPDAHGESEAIADVLVPEGEGLYCIRVEVMQDLKHAHDLAIYGDPVTIEQRDIGFVVIDGNPKTPCILEIDGPSMQIEGKRCFWAGTHYYPSSSWWEWLWRDFRPLNCDIDFEGMRRTGYRIVRIWIDPILDEQTLRAMDAAIYLASVHGIILDICIFTQWIRTLGFERHDGEHVSFDFRAKGDFNIYGISLRNISLQKEYVCILASRWRDAGNIMYNLANETYIKDPDPSQMDPSISWEDIPVGNSSYRDSCIFRKWAIEISTAIRNCGGEQPILPGYMFSLSDGGDNHIANRDGDIEPWHCYLGSLTGVTLTYFDPICTNRPIILEEFGTNGWNNPDNYNDNVHYALGSGAAAAMSYEWGVSWLAPEMCFVALPIREILLEQDIDERWFAPALEIARSWPANAVGICATSSGFAYGSIYHGTPFPADAAIVLGRYGIMGYRLDRAYREESAYIVIPTASNDHMEPVFNTIRGLWKSASVFGVWHEDSLDNLPASTRVLIVPHVTDTLRCRLDEISTKGVKVMYPPYDASSGISEVPRLDVSPSGILELQVRRTTDGTLYSLGSNDYAGEVSLTTECGSVIRGGIDRYLLIHQYGESIDFIEACSNVEIQGTDFCTISNGRIIARTPDGSSLIRSSIVMILCTDPCTVRFNKNIASVGILINGTNPYLAECGTKVFNDNTLEVDNEMCRHAMEVCFL